MELGDVGREVGGDLGTIRELDKKEFVLGIARLQECHGGVACRRNFVFHAAANVKNHADADRDVFSREVRDLLFELIFPDLKVFLAQSADVPIERIRDRSVHKNQIYIDF